MSEPEDVPAVGILAGHQRKAEGHAGWIAGAGRLEPRAFGGQSVEIGRAHIGVAREPERVAPKLVREDYDEVGLTRHSTPAPLTIV